MSPRTVSLKQPGDALFPVPSAEMLSSQGSIPCQVVHPAHPYACCYTSNSMHLLFVLWGCPGRQADRMSLAPRPVRQDRICWVGERGHRGAQGRLVLYCGWGWTSYLVRKVDSVSTSAGGCSNWPYLAIRLFLCGNTLFQLRSVIFDVYPNYIISKNREQSM